MPAVMRTLRVSLATLLLLGCAGADQPPPVTPSPPAVGVTASTPPPSDTSPTPAKPAPERVAEDSPRATTGGATFTVPAGWTIFTDGATTLLTGPEPDLKMAFVEGPAKTADEAVASAWPALHPGFKRPLRLAQPIPGRHGWDEGKRYEYETSPDEKLAVIAYALRSGDAWFVVLGEASEASREKRIAGYALVRESLRPKGVSKESFAGKTAHELDADRIKQITDLVQQGQHALDIPGVAISLIQGGKVVFEGGFGERELGKPAKVDADSLFIIASNTKALASLLLAKEIDDGKFTWDTPVTQVYPSFKLGDADTTSKVLMKHLICACTGMPRQDLEWLLQFGDATPKSEIALLGTFQPTTKFGETFQYSNLMAAAAGFIGGSVAYPKKDLGQAFDEAMKTRLFEPMDMRATTFDFAKAMGADHASPHSRDVDGNMKNATMDIDRSIVPLRPAGGAWTSAKDLTKYVQMELANGKLPNGKELVSATNLLARRAPQVTIGETTTYGMGLEVDREWGIPIVHHGGDLPGYHSDMFWLPEQGIGGVILTNADGGWALRGPFLRKVLEVAFDGKPEALEDVLSAAKRMKASIAKERERLTVPPAADVVAKLAKHYRSNALGDVIVNTKGTTCTFDLGEWKSAVASRKNEDGTTSMITMEPGKGGFEFVVGEREGKRVLVMRDAQHEYVMTEAP
jgi:CubicO group peptidase (beta-lactamase class C family)